MKYNGFYFWMFKSPMKKVLAEKYGREYAADIMKKSKKVYRELVEKADDIGDDNPMAYNELFALAFVAPYVASEKKIPPTTVQEMMRRSLYHIKWYFAKTDLNTDKGKAENKKSVVKYAKWYTPDKEAKYPTSFKVDFVGQPYEGACYYRITRCPICIYTEKLGVSSDLPSGSLLAFHHKAAVESVNSHQLIVRALLNDFAVIDHEYPIGVAHGFQPVGDHNDRLIVGQFRNGLLQLLFIFVVNIQH